MAAAPRTPATGATAEVQLSWGAVPARAPPGHPQPGRTGDRAPHGQAGVRRPCRSRAAAAGRAAAAWPERVSIQVRLTPARGYEGEECALDVDVTGPGDHEAELTLRPGEAIEPATGPPATGSRVRFTITLPNRGW